MIEIRELTHKNWDDFVSLMETDRQCADCWCLNHRKPAGCATGSAAKEIMKALPVEQKVCSLVGYANSECVGWISIDPMSSLVGHDLQATGKDHEWSIHYIFIKEGFRGQGLSTRLIQSAIEYAKSNGVKVISAFPIPPENQSRFPKDEAEFSGRFSTYKKIGFTPVGQASELYQRMELE